MKVLIAGESSGVIREAFRKQGHDAWSCDLQPADDGSEFHLQCDMFTVLNDGWDLMIAIENPVDLTQQALRAEPTS